MHIIIATNQLIIILLSIGLLISTLEYLKKIKIFAPAGLLSWNVMQMRWEHSDKKLYYKAFKRLFNEKGLSIIFGIRCFILIALLFFPIQSFYGWALLLLLGISLMTSSMITFYGSDGSDQMNMLIIITLVLCNYPILTNAKLPLIGLWFIAAQACLSYTAAGIAKLASAEWRASTAIKDVFSTRTYGSKVVAEVLRKHPFVNVFLCWNVMIMETLFPICLILPWNYALPFLVWGFIFHFLTAAIMGLNSFFWAFISTYPAIYFVNHQNVWHLF